MATEKIVRRTDDLQPTYHTGVEPVEFSYKGVDYSIDLAKVNRDVFDRVMNKYITAGSVRKVSGVVKTTDPETENRSALIRSWAKTQGIYVNPLGMIPRDVQNQYDNYQNYLNNKLGYSNNNELKAV